MGEVLPIPGFGDLFADTRGGDRTMRVSYHADREALVLSLWSGAVCRGSFRMARGDVPRLLALLAAVTAADPTATPPDATPPDRTDPRVGVVRRPAVAAGGDPAGGPAHRDVPPVVPAPRGESAPRREPAPRVAPTPRVA
ncbi:hypothetical protein [Micromonospora globbae]|uniref:hypothetical protein n=1 Tax=Micromonospora globbae TaxID=1894969 RepID=UPI00387018AD|nr:hypothetical protein OH732_17020 [Micromonospora globbae]